VGVAYLEKYGESVLENGYSICAIRPGEKRPFGKDWEAQKFGPKTLAGFIANDRGGFGVGIKTARTPGVDIDCYDVDLVEHMKAFVIDMLGDTLERVGLAPKTLLVYRCKTPFPKTQSKVFIDDEGRSVKLEVLADGQQFVALHVHPDTNKPYRWKDKRHPGNTPRAELPTIDQDAALAIVVEFEKEARARGWPEKKSGSNLAARSGDFDYDDPFITDKQKIELPAEEIRKKLDKVPDPDDHDHWFKVGMALYHQFDGSEQGLEMWHEWSAQASNYDQDALDYRWSTFEIEGKKREPLTARYILKYAQAEEERLAGERLDELKDKIRGASAMPTLNEACNAIKKEAFDLVHREMLAGMVQKQIERITGTKIAITSVRTMVRFENPENTATPTWMERFVYLRARDEFYSTRNHEAMKLKAFDSSYARYMMTKKDRLEGKTTPEHTASHAALNRYEIPTVSDVRYMPGQPDIFDLDGVTYVNRFSEHTFPEAPEVLNKRGRKMVDRFLRHMEHLFADERDRKLLLSWMAYIVQTNGRSNWCPVIQGAEGDGKTTVAVVLSASLGGSHNCATINGDSMAEKYTPWAEGKLFLFIEEVRLHGENRYDVLNKLKPYITNDAVPIRRMNTDVYNVPNTVNYMMGTNFKNALPLNEEDTRYFPIFSRWQSKKRLDAFKAANPDYYVELAELVEHGDALRRFFLDYELHPEFNPRGRATMSAARREMIALNRTDEDAFFDDAMFDSTDPYVCESILDPQHAAETVDGLSIPYGRAGNTWLTERGWTHLGRFKLDGKKRSIWSQEPERFQGKTDKDTAAAIRKFIELGGDHI
jgi:hypothetical protein